jgi:hypothetical protein
LQQSVAIGILTEEIIIKTLAQNAGKKDTDNRGKQGFGLCNIKSSIS